MELTLEHSMLCKPIDYFYQPPLQWVLIFYPENEGHIPDLCDIVKLDTLEKQLYLYKNRVSEFESHPYVKFGLRMYRAIRRIRRLLR